MSWIKKKKPPARKKAPLGTTDRVLRRLGLKRPTGARKGIPKWIKAIPISQAHGSGILQKKLWKMTSDLVRIRDWYKYRTCVATGRRIERWQDGQAGHFRSYSKCNALYKFDIRNIHMQSYSSNAWGDFDDWKAYEQELERRGVDIKGFLKDNLKATGSQLTNTMVIEQMEVILKLMANLHEQPDYYDRVMELWG